MVDTFFCEKVFVNSMEKTATKRARQWNDNIYPYGRRLLAENSKNKFWVFFLTTSVQQIG